MRYARENEITYAQAQLRLGKAEIGELQAFINKAHEHMGEYDLDLNNMSIKARITRYQALEKQIDAVLQQLYGVDYQSKGEELLKDIYSDAYYKTWFNIDQYHGFHQEFAQINAKTVEELIRYPFNGAGFSERLWKQKDHMLQGLNESITTMLVQGRNPKSLTKEFTAKFGAKKKEAYRLLHTEMSFIQEQGALAAYKEDGVEKYEILATLDIKTSEICREQDGKVYDIDKWNTGVNAPPFHPHCRTTTVPFYDEGEKGERVARDPVTGESIKVPADMKYTEWHKKYIESSPEAMLAEAKIENAYADRLQYAKYKSMLAEASPKSFKAFQDVKYTDANEYGVLKTQYKGMGYYDAAVANEPDITATVLETASTVGMDTAGLEYRVKSKESYLRKIRSNYSPDGNEYEVKDILRYTYTAKPEELAQKTLESIDEYTRKGYNTIEIKNYWLDKYNPYNGVNTTLKAPSGQKFELQYHTEESFNLKNGKLHELYEKQRLLEDETFVEFLRLKDEMFDLSNQLTVPASIERVKNLK